MAQQDHATDISVHFVKKSNSCNNDTKNSIESQILKWAMSKDRHKKTVLAGLNQYVFNHLKKGGLIYKGDGHLLNSGIVAMDYAVTFKINGEIYTFLFLKRKVK